MRHFLLALFICIAHLAVSQKRNEKKLEKLAGDLLKVEDYASACPIVDSLDLAFNTDPQHAYFKGLCVFHMANKVKSLPYFKTAYAGHYKDPEMSYYLGRAFHFNLLFDSAQYYYRSYLKTLDTLHKKHFDKRHAEVNQYIQNCETGKKMIEDSLEIFIENAGPKVNGAYPDYSPVISSDESVLFFTSRRQGSTGNEIADDGKFYEDVYMSTKDTNGKWSDPVQMGDSINTPGHDACIGLSPDGQKLYVYRSWRKKDASGDLYLSRLTGHRWSTPTKIHGEINTKSWESSISISPNEDMVFFSSDREGGFGGSDIYCMKKGEDGKYMHPFNLGPKINTAYDEDSPLIHADSRTLFFSSKGHPGMGGYDVFSSTFNDTVWSEPINLGYPISTPGDDIYFSYTADGSKGYFSSYRRDSYGEKDIYIIHRPDDSPSMVVFKGYIKDTETNQPIAATIKLSDPTTGQTENIFNSNVATGKYLVVLGLNKTYDVTIESEGYMYKSERIHIPEQKVFQYVRNFFLQLIKKPSDVHISEIREAELQEEIEVHDSHSANSSTKTKGENWRSHSLDYTSARFQSVQDTSDTKNLRFFDKDSGYVVRRTIKYNEAYFNAESENMYTMNISMEKLKVGAKFILRNIHFDFDKDTIRNSSKPELDRLFNLLQQNRALSLEIGGHTDNKGKIDYNIDLSRRRAQSVVNYLVNKGIDPKRLRASGYGETVPITSNNTSFGRQFNRRTEFEILDTTLHYLNHPIKASQHQLAEDYWRELPMKAHFEPNVGNKLYSFSKQRLDELVAFLNLNKKIKVVLIARADETIEDQAQLLIKQRARLVNNYLINKGISQSRIVTKPAKDLPGYIIPSVVTGEISNRRVEFYIIN